jgi:hypothetical protein
MCELLHGSGTWYIKKNPLKHKNMQFLQQQKYCWRISFLFPPIVIIIKKKNPEANSKEMKFVNNIFVVAKIACSYVWGDSF